MISSTDNLLIPSQNMKVFAVFLAFSLLYVINTCMYYPSNIHTTHIQTNPNFPPTPKWNNREPDAFTKLLQMEKQSTQGETSELQLIPKTSGFWIRLVLKRFREQREKRYKNDEE